ncbi:hypothetical protein K432DRAFT_377389 [Lepidopterella palustris CBS 459.81]|uniref:Uncharacterized protein n=1 Tax=Lepidopterella palustris CBS 459.81 TaxID=1314670 RepID=A0A8E2EL18_9PEZI|nr:hypothetical protein K432DRAFT_377389 [Lepidopterella palustris CBS 459.81]
MANHPPRSPFRQRRSYRSQQSYTPKTGFGADQTQPQYPTFSLPVTSSFYDPSSNPQPQPHCTSAHFRKPSSLSHGHLDLSSSEIPTLQSHHGEPPSHSHFHERGWDNDTTRTPGSSYPPRPLPSPSISSHGIPSGYTFRNRDAPMSLLQSSLSSTENRQPQDNFKNNITFQNMPTNSAALRPPCLPNPQRSQHIAIPQTRRMPEIDRLYAYSGVSVPSTSPSSPSPARFSSGNGSLPNHEENNGNQPRHRRSYERRRDRFLSPHDKTRLDMPRALQRRPSQDSYNRRRDQYTSPPSHRIPDSYTSSRLGLPSPYQARPLSPSTFSSQHSLLPPPPLYPPPRSLGPPGPPTATMRRRNWDSLQ